MTIPADYLIDLAALISHVSASKICTYIKIQVLKFIAEHVLGPCTKFNVTTYDITSANQRPDDLCHAASQTLD